MEKKPGQKKLDEAVKETFPASDAASPNPGASDRPAGPPRRPIPMERIARAVWRGGLKDGQGTLESGSGVLKGTRYSFATRFEHGVGTNPEELIAAAHAGCFSMALSGELGKAGIKPESIETSAVVMMEKRDEGWTISEVRLATVVTAAGADRGKFEAAAQAAKAGCPVSRALRAKVSLAARLKSP